jgi:hypothetical protein
VTPLASKTRPAKCAIRAALVGDNTAIAGGHTITANLPVLALCRSLVEAGVDPNTPLDAYRGDTLALQVRCIGEGARLELNGDGVGFRPRRWPDAASPVAKSGSVDTGHRPAREAAL